MMDKITVRHKVCGTRYYVTEQMLKDSPNTFERIEEDPVETTESKEVEKTVDPVEEIKQKLRDKGIYFHPATKDINKLRKKLEEAE